ncbi:alpha/beta hydrolase [Streptomyces sp. NPDC050856]|uniref:alpha/beta hydrolase n=1 Tax=Streptomyces sp. NPDC050856 TaxID=3154939 RepID=UPI0033F40062
MRSQRFAPLIAAGVLASLLPALVPAAQASAAPVPQYLQQKPAWHRCDPEQPAAFQCATIKVPLDYRKPAGRKIDLSISRLKATSPTKRHGVLLLNPGGPGGGGADLPPMVGEFMPKQVRERYDLIGFDPRGVGRSSPVSCGLTDAEQNTERPYNAATFKADVSWARGVARKCQAKAGAVLPHLTTRNTARDMDAIRAVLGERKISYLGYSYGTYLGAVYSQMYPHRTDRFVLDSGVDPQRIWRGMMQVWASGSAPAFTRWTKWTAERASHYRLGRTPAAVSTTFWGLVARADRDPIVIDGQKFTGDDIRAHRPIFFSPKDAAEFVAALKAAAEGGTAKARLPETARRAVEAPEDNTTAVFWAVVCGDTGAWPRDPEQYRRDAVRDKARYPLYGDFASNIKPCAFWQKPVEAATRVDNRKGVLTVQNEWDSQTPLSSGRGLHRALKGSRMVLAAGGEGHGVYLFDPASCVNGTVNAYLTTGKLPAKDVTCRSVGAPKRDGLARELPPRFPAEAGRF